MILTKIGHLGKSADQIQSLWRLQMPFTVDCSEKKNIGNENEAGISHFYEDRVVVSSDLAFLRLGVGPKVSKVAAPSAAAACISCIYYSSTVWPEKIAKCL